MQIDCKTKTTVIIRCIKSKYINSKSFVLAPDVYKLCWPHSKLNSLNYNFLTYMKGID